MTREEFWKVIDAARRDADDPEDVGEILTESLQSLSTEEIAQFNDHMWTLMEQSYSWNLWGAAYLINGGCSDDGFDYFRGGLIGFGRAVFEQALADPDSLAGVLDDELEGEDTLAAAATAYHDKTGRYPERPIKFPELGEGWDFDDNDEMSRRYPKLYAKFG